MLTPFIDTSDWSDLFPDLGTLQESVTGAKDSRGVDLKTLANVPGLVGLPCVIENKGGDEVPDSAGNTRTSTHTVTFQSYHSAITEKMTFVARGDKYNVLLASADPMRIVSILKVRKITS